MVARREKMFYEVENAGNEISFRCIKCRTCKDCKHHESNEGMSFKEEVEQDLINKSICVDTNRRVTVASLPLLQDPTIRLSNNKDIALKVYNQQLMKLHKIPQDLDDVIKCEKELQALGHVDYVKNLSKDQQVQLKDSAIQNYIPWRAVWKGNSFITPCRIAFDALQTTRSGYSLNDLLAKGKNNMNNLVEIVIRWSMYKIAFHTDIKKMYNAVKLREEDWCLQKYIWEESLNPAKIKTLIYGVRSSGNQAERGLRQTAEISKDSYPKVNEIVQNDIYVDDCLSRRDSEGTVLNTSDQVELVLNRGGYSLKGAPLESLSEDGITVKVAGMKWIPEEDTLSLDISEFNFAKKIIQYFSCGN